MINTNHLSIEATKKLLNLDKSFFGTNDYMGFSYFWSYEYRHYLRDVSYAKRRRVHKELLKSGLAVNGESLKHLQIIRNITKLK
tara:strand:+ start:784 stop:1035 length:252 start_codon:yes stop_codon:yes gene_type:complete